jgi:ABC-type glycerol-3-phosphate transport system substrate-binding protein
MRFFRWLGMLLLVFASACNALPTATLTATVENTPTSIPTLQPTRAVTPTAAGPVTLHIWLPPEFDPQAGTPAAEILKARLDEFASRRPNTRVEVRLKALDGPGGILDSLTAANAAAPLAMPDLVALPRASLEAAALKGLLRPFDDLIEPVEDADWYEYARQMARLQDSTFGLPFAGDAQILVHRTTSIPEPPETLSDTLTTAEPLVFAAADPQALFTLAQYQANGGTTLDEQGRPTLDPIPLVDVLDYYQRAATSEVIPFWVTQYQTQEQVWEAFNDGSANMIVSWASQHLKNMVADSAGAGLPTLSGQPYTLATGWVWALASPDPEKQKLSADLAEFLSEGDFLSRWTTALGYLPTRPSAMANWGSASQRNLASEVVSSAQLIPSGDVLNSISPLLLNATINVLKQQAEPAVAAREAAESLNQP